MSSLKTTIAAGVALAALGAAAPASADELRFQVTGAYSFADTFDVMAPTDGVIARAGRLTGAWRLEEQTSKRSGNAHLNAATAVRIVPGEAPSLMGTMELNMAEYENSAPGSDALYLAYEGTRFEQSGPSVTTITVTGRVVGGRGRYAGARGDLNVVSINGFIEGGRMTVRLADR